MAARLRDAEAGCDAMDTTLVVGSLLPIDANLRDVLVPGVCPVYDDEGQVRYVDADGEYLTHPAQDAEDGECKMIIGKPLDPYGIDRVIRDVFTRDFQEVLAEPTPPYEMSEFSLLPSALSPSLLSGADAHIPAVPAVQRAPGSMEEKLSLQAGVSYDAVLVDLRRRVPGASQDAYDQMIRDMYSEDPVVVARRAVRPLLPSRSPPSRVVDSASRSTDRHPFRSPPDVPPARTGPGPTPASSAPAPPPTVTSTHATTI